MFIVDLQLAAPEVSDARDLEIGVSIRNASNRPAPLSTVPLAYGSAVLQVCDAHSNPVPLVPPSVPPADPASGRIELAPGAAAAFRYQGGTLFDSPLPSGRYAVRFRLTTVHDPTASDGSGELTSAWVPFVIA